MYTTEILSRLTQEIFGPVILVLLAKEVTPEMMKNYGLVSVTRDLNTQVIMQRAYEAVNRVIKTKKT